MVEGAHDAHYHKRWKSISFCSHPKCAGTSVEDYIMDAGVEIAFLNRRHDVENPEKNWSVSSPQHIDGQSLSEIFPESYFHSFWYL